jgi:hypothetical protein
MPRYTRNRARPQGLLTAPLMFVLLLKKDLQNENTSHAVTEPAIS